MAKKAKMTTYAQIGLGHRSLMYADAIGDPFKATAKLVAMADSNPGRLQLRADYMRDKYNLDDIALYSADDFVRMLKETRPDYLIVTTGPDVTHEQYIVKAMEMGVDVVTEKPLTIDAARCRKIVDASKRTGKSVRVTFNYRYSPPRSQLKELLDSGLIGKVLSVDFEWALDTSHGADYFRRWHRQKGNSGGLMVHKSTHHFDLMNWWLGQDPVSVSAMGRRGYYGADSGVAKALGLAKHGERCLVCSCKKKCPFYLDLSKSERLRTYYLDNEKYDKYYRDRCVFAKEMDIEDSMAVMVRYDQGVIMSYCLNAFLPWEGYRISFNGTKGRLEHGTVESSYIAGDGRVQGGTIQAKTYIHHYPSFAEMRELEVRVGQGGHGGGDKVMLADIFAPDKKRDPLRRAAGLADGAYSILVGIAANQSMKTGKSVDIAKLVKDIPKPSWKK